MFVNLIVNTAEKELAQYSCLRNHWEDGVKHMLSLKDVQKNGLTK